MTEHHYPSDPLGDRVDAALDAAGFADGAPVPWDALAPLDQFHLGGLRATGELADVLDPAPGSRVLDLGSGLGGPARLLAAQRDCHVTGIDLTAAFVEVATRLSERCGMQAQTEFVQGDVTALPFADGQFDHAWTQHVAMNVADRAALYGEARRVLRDGGRLALFDAVAGYGEPLTFPVPWASSPQASHLLTAEATRTAVEAAGFEVISSEDLSQTAIGWLSAQRGPAPAGLDLGLAMGARFGGMAANYAANLASGRVGVLRLVARARS